MPHSSSSLLAPDDANAAAGQLAALVAFMNDKNLELKELFEQIDTGGDGDISPMELHVMLGKIGLAVSPTDCYALVKQLDYSGDGALSIDELEEDCSSTTTSRHHRIE